MGIMTTGPDFERGDIAQITQAGHYWRGVFVVVDEVKNWGIEGHMLIPQGREVGMAPIRLAYDEIERVGHVAI